MKKEQIIEHLKQQIIHNESLGIFCGHYPLVALNGKPLAGIYQEIEDEKLKEKIRKNPYAAEFPLETFLFGVEILKLFPKSKLISLVNDWLMIPKNVSGEKENPYRQSYYQSEKLPAVYQSHLTALGNPEDLYLHVPKKYRTYGSHLHFGETRFRNIYKNKFKSVCSLEHGCAQEFVPFLHALHEAGMKELVCLIPGTCKVPTLDGIKDVIHRSKLELTIWSLYFYNTTEISNFWTGVDVFKNGEYETHTNFNED